MKKTAESVETAPTTKGTIVLGDFVFEPPADFDGNGTYAVENQGNQVHELALFKIADGKTLDDVKGFILTPPGTPPPAGPPPFTEVGGTVGLSSNQTAWLDLKLAPGEYAMFCFFPDPTKDDHAPRARGDDQGVHGHLIRRRGTGGRTRVRPPVPSVRSSGPRPRAGSRRSRSGPTRRSRCGAGTCPGRASPVGTRPSRGARR